MSGFKEIVKKYANYCILCSVNMVTKEWEDRAHKAESLLSGSLKLSKHIKTIRFEKGSNEWIT